MKKKTWGTFKTDFQSIIFFTKINQTAAVCRVKKNVVINNKLYKTRMFQPNKVFEE